MIDWRVGDLFVIKPEYRSMGRGSVPDPRGVGFIEQMSDEIIWKVKSLCEGAHKIFAESVDEHDIYDDRYAFYFDKAWIEPFDRGEDDDDDGKGLIDA